jgi:glycosyltransferase involved in cell wall biosynthesis
MKKILPKVAIGLPVYNGEKYLGFAIDSLLAQTYHDFHLYISNNASNDTTHEICEMYAKKDPRIKYVKQAKNIGAVKNFDYVKTLASDYQFFMWVAHDDYWDINWLAELIAEIKPTDLAVRGRAFNVDQSNNFLAETKVKSFNKGGVLSVFLDDEKNGRAFYFYALFNNALLKQTNFDLLNLDKYYGSDTFFVCHWIQFGSLRTVSSTTQYYRRHLQSTTNAYAKQWFGLKRLAFYLFPISTYIYTLKVVDKKYWPLIIFAIPVKFVKSQLNIWPRIFRLIITGKTI